MSRSSRSVPNTFIFSPDSSEDLTHLTHSHTHLEDLPTVTTGSRLQRLRIVWKLMQHSVMDIKEKLMRFRKFWSSLPESICQEEHVATVENENCWNGIEQGRFDPEVQKDVWILQENNSTDSSRPDAVVRQQIMALRMMSNKLKNAYHGTDLHFQDSVSDEESSGSGSGSGSGVTESESFRTDPTDPTHPTHTPVQEQENRDETSSASSVRPEVLLLFFSVLAVR
ncbi:unnamed protein product [Leuciscus chuanchicus]